MRVTWNVHSVLLSYPYLGYCFWKSINNNTQSMGETGQDTFFPSFSSPFSPSFAITVFEDLEFLLDVQASMFLLLALPSLLSAVHTMFRVTKEIFRRVFQRSALRVDS